MNTWSFVTQINYILGFFKKVVINDEMKGINFQLNRKNNKLKIDSNLIFYILLQTSVENVGPAPKD